MKTKVKLIKKETVAEGTMAFHFSKSDGFEFRAGQFADYTLIDPAETDAEGDTRGFSLVQAPFEPDLVAATRQPRSGCCLPRWSWRKAQTCVVG